MSIIWKDIDIIFEASYSGKLCGVQIRQHLSPTLYHVVAKNNKSFVGDPEVFDRNLSKEKVRDYIQAAVS